LIVVAALAAPLAIGLGVFRDYGLPWDEPAQRTIGRQAWGLAFEGNPPYLSNADRSCGPAFEMLLFGAERYLGLEGDARRVFFMRHLVTYLVFWISSVALFDMVRRRQGAPLGLVAALLLFCSPRIFAGAFYDTEDLAFLSFLVLAVWTLGRYVERPSHARAALHGVLCAFASDVRLAGVLVVAMTLAAFPLGEAGRGLSGRRARVATVLTFLGAVCAAGVAFWPLLWHDPVRSLIDSVRRMAHGPGPGDVLFLGRLVPATDLPWYYVPVWIAISTPPVFLAFFAVGTVRALRESCVPGVPLTTRADRLLLLTWFSAPILLGIVLRSVQYDGWRQLYFVYPAFVMLATLGVESAWRVARGAARPAWLRAAASAALLALALDVAVTATWMARWHPHQNVYFNAAAGGPERIAGSFDVDDRGLGCRRVLEQLLEVEPKGRIAIQSPGGACWASTRLLPPAERGRFVNARSPGEADYVVAYHRRLVPVPSVPDERLAVRVDGLLVASARRVRGGSEEGERPPRGAAGRVAPEPDSP
jgi:hypothetical protein